MVRIANKMLDDMNMNKSRRLFTIKDTTMAPKQPEKLGRRGEAGALQGVKLRAFKSTHIELSSRARARHKTYHVDCSRLY